MTLHRCRSAFKCHCSKYRISATAHTHLVVAAGYPPHSQLPVPPSAPMAYMTSRRMPTMSMGYAPAPPPVYHFPQSLSANPSQQVFAALSYSLWLHQQVAPQCAEPVTQPVYIHSLLSADRIRSCCCFNTDALGFGFLRVKTYVLLLHTLCSVLLQSSINTHLSNSFALLTSNHCGRSLTVMLERKLTAKVVQGQCPSALEATAMQAITSSLPHKPQAT